MRKEINVYFDTEFTGIRKGTELISIGLIDELGKTFYAELNDYDPQPIKENKWIQENVINNLDFNNKEKHFVNFKNNLRIKGDSKYVANELRKWFLNYSPKTVLLLSDGGIKYDFKLFKDLFDGEIPDNIICMTSVSLWDQKLKDNKILKKVQECMEEYNGRKHNALDDAIAIKKTYECFKSVM